MNNSFDYWLVKRIVLVKRHCLFESKINFFFVYFQVSGGEDNADDGTTTTTTAPIQLTKTTWTKYSNTSFRDLKSFQNEFTILKEGKVMVKCNQFATKLIKSRCNSLVIQLNKRFRDRNKPFINIYVWVGSVVKCLVL